MRRTGSLAAVLLLLLTACTPAAEDVVSDRSSTNSSSDSSPTDSAPPATTAPAEPSPSDEPTGGEGAAGTAADREQLAWYLALLDQPDTLDETTYAAHFDQAFRDQVPFSQFAQITTQVATGAPYTLGDIRPANPGIVAQAVASDGTAIVITLSTTPDGSIGGLLLQPADPPELEDPPADLAEAVDRLAALGRQVGVVAAEVTTTADAAEVRILAEVNGSEPIAIGSAFKLYVLGAVADAVRTGKLGWSDELTITPEVKSLPSGVLQTRADGSTVTVQEAAELMIGISDNTATDLLIHAVGREVVEAAQRSWGHSAPQHNVPFFTTRELFALKTGGVELQDRYLGADDQEQRGILADLADVPLEDIPVEAFLAEPVRPDELEWFAAPRDLIETLARLLEAGRRDPQLAPLVGILTQNPGVPAEGGRWTQIAFKGGSEPGLITMAWVVEDGDGNRFGLAGSVVDPETAFDPGEAILLMAAARDLLGS